MDITEDQTIRDPPAPEKGVPPKDQPDTGSKPDLIRPNVPDKEVDPPDPSPEMDPDDDGTEKRQAAQERTYCPVRISNTFFSPNPIVSATDCRMSCSSAVASAKSLAIRSVVTAMRYSPGGRALNV